MKREATYVGVLGLEVVQTFAHEDILRRDVGEDELKLSRVVLVCQSVVGNLVQRGAVG